MQYNFVCDGNYTPFAADVAACGNHGFWFEVFTDLDYMAGLVSQDLNKQVGKNFIETVYPDDARGINPNPFGLFPTHQKDGSQTGFPGVCIIG